MSTQVRQGGMVTTRIPVAQAASEFLSRQRIAVTGVSRHPESHGGNVVYKRLRERGYQVFAVNPSALSVEGDVCYPDLRSIRGGVEAVVIATSPAHASATVRECVELGVDHIWMHRSVDGGSVSHEAAELAREHGLSVIEGGCPLMFAPVSDPAHKVMRFVLSFSGRVPRAVELPNDPDDAGLLATPGASAGGHAGTERR
ncbi:MAG TPA: CoA-binding protein [Candidatus Dormibacteraeota bacterium]